MSDTAKIGLARVAKALFTLAAGAAGAWLSWGFGAELGGVAMGLVAAVNGAAMSMLLTGAALDRVLARRREDA